MDSFSDLSLGISSILQNVRILYGLSGSTEITMEMDPGTFDTLRLLKLKKMGINRISMGVQSFNDSILKSCGRAHSVDDVFAALKCLEEAKIDSYSIDLISSLPGMDLELWSDTLHKAGGLGPPHLSVYDLQIEEKTAFGRWYSPGNEFYHFFIPFLHY